MPAVFKEFLQVGAMLILLPPAPPVVNLDGTGLRMEWAIERTRTSTPDRGSIVIYNLSTAARKAIHEVWKQIEGTVGYVVEFSIGWGNLVERIFVGDCWKLVPERRVGEDVLTIMEVGDGNKQVRDASIVGATSYQNLAVETVVVNAVTKYLRLPIDPASLAKIKEKTALLPLRKFNNWAAYGDTQDRLDEVIDMLGLEWKIYQGSFIVTDKGNAATASPTATRLAAGSGLLDWSQEDDGGIHVTALANPNVKPGSQIQVVDSFDIPVGAPAHRVEKVAFRGTTDGESLMEIVGRRATLL